MRKVLFISSILLFLVSQGQSPYLDSEFRNWCDMAENNQLTDLQNSLKTELQKEEPHVLAWCVWRSLAEHQTDEYLALINSERRPQAEQLIGAQSANQRDDNRAFIESEGHPEYHFVQGGFNYYLNAFNGVNTVKAYQLTKEWMNINSTADFGVVWTITEQMQSNHQIYLQVQDDLNQGVYDAHETFKQYLKAVIQFYPVNDRNLIDPLNAYLDLSPNDPMAHRYLAKIYKKDMHYHMAIKHYELSIELDPFYEANYTDLASCYDMLYKAEEVVKVALKAQQMLNPMDTTYHHLLLVNSYTNSQHYGLVKPHLEIALQQANTSAYKAYLQFKNAIDYEPLNLVDLSTLLRHQTNDQQFYSDLVDFLEKQDDEMAMELAENAVSRFTYPSPDLYDNLYFNLKDTARKIALLESLVKHYPENEGRWYSLGYYYSNTGEHLKAAEAYKKALVIAPSDRLDWKKLNQSINLIAGDSGISNELITATQNMPYIAAIWQAFVEESHSDNAARYNLWMDVLKRYPQRYFPIDNVNYGMINNKEWDATQSLFAANDSAIMASGNRYEIIEYLYDQMLLYSRKAKHSYLTEDEKKKAFEVCDQFIAYFGRPHLAYVKKYEIALGIQDRALAGEHLRAALDANPNLDMYNAFWTKTSSGYRFQYMKQAVDRNPFEDFWRSRFVQFNVNGLWGGSSIEAMIAGEQYLEDFPDGAYRSNVKSYMKTALGDFGDNISMYQQQYRDNSTLGNSNLYISFYKQALDNALKGSNQVIIDHENHSAKVISEEGETMILEENQHCGKTSLLKKGEAFIRFEYTDDCSLKGIYTGAGPVIELDYNEKGKITASRSAKISLEITYDTLDHIKYMANTVDTVFTEYDSLGNLLHIESNGGYELTMRMTSMFTDLANYSKIPEQAYSHLKRGSLPDLTDYDENYNLLKDQYYSAEEETYYAAALAFSNYLLNNIAADQDFGTELCELSIEAIGNLKGAHNKIKQKYSVGIIDNFYQCLLTTRRNGVSMDYWEDWVASFEWLVTERQSQKKKKKYYDALLSLEQRIYQTPIQLLKQSNWLVKDDLSKQAFWREINPKTLIAPELVDGFQINCSYLYGEDLIALGTNRGLLIKFPEWRWYGYNKESKKLELNPDPSTMGATSVINSLTYLGNGKAVIGTDDGILIWDPSDNSVERLSMFNGLRANKIKELIGLQLADESIMILINTSAGFQSMDIDLNFTDYEYMNGKTINDIHFKPAQDILFACEDGVYSWTTDSFSKLANHRANYVAYLQDNTPMYHDGVELYKVVHSGASDENLSIDLKLLSTNITTTERGRVHGLDLMYFDGEPYMIALTDNGVSIYRYSHFEHLQIKARDGSIPEIKGYSSFSDTRMFYSNNMVYLYDYSKISYSDGVYQDMLSLENGVTLFAGDGSLTYTPAKYPYHFSPARIEYLNNEDDDYYSGYYSSSYSSHLFKTGQNSVLFNSGTKICKGVVDSFGNITTRVLFRIDLSGHENYNGSSDLINMIEDSKGRIWVSTSLRLYRYDPSLSEPLKVFCYFDDDESFDVNTNDLGHIFELADGRIWLSASDNGHNSYKNRRLEGGLFEYRDSGFVKLNTSKQAFSFFLTSQTALNENEEIFGSTKGIQMYRNGIITNFKYLSEAEKNPSYAKLYEKKSALYLSTEGAQLGDVTLLGTPSGLIGYRQDQWFDLSKLNQLLPKIEETQNYGGTHIYAVAVNNNVIYASTPMGTMIYNFGEQDPINLIIEPTDIDKMLVYTQATKLKEQQSIIKGLPKESKAAELVAEIEDNQEKIIELKKLKSVEQDYSMSGREFNLDADSLKEVVKELDRKNAALFLSLQQQEPAIYQMLKIPPLDLMSSRAKLNNGECILQYIAMPDELFIHLLTKDHSQVFNIPIPRDTILSLAANVHQLLKSQTGISRGVVMDDYGDDNGLVLTKGLKELYNWLIRPVENQLSGYDQVFVVPTEQLFYVPFACLIKEDKSNGDKYLVQEHNIGMLSSMYLFDLVYLMEEKTGGTVELFGDPDGSLPGAKAEVEAISSSYPTASVYIGEKASRNAFDNCAERAGTIHLATHGDLDEKDLSKSSLLFSDGKLSLPELITMRMPNANMVVLSACETGVGQSGIEYTSLARAFSGAGVPRVLATLWQVNDQASKDMMIHFYQGLDTYSTRLEAFSEAQRKMIEDERYADNPYLWAGYYYMGKP